MERVLMAIERLSMHLAGHDRALAEVMQTRGTMQRLDELSDRIDDIAAVSVPEQEVVTPAAASGGDSEPRGDCVRCASRRGDGGRRSGRSREADGQARQDGVVDRLAPAPSRRIRRTRPRQLDFAV